MRAAQLRNDMPNLAFQTPDGSSEQLRTVLDAAIRHFPANPLAIKLENGAFGMDDYHSVLRTLFHQVYFSSSTFSLAAARCSPDQDQVRDYLIRHAEEEKDHWKWVLSDLEKTGYRGMDPRQEFPRASTQAYIAFNYFVAGKMPLARLAIALMLESVGATFGKRYGQKLLKALGTTTEQTLFFFGHGDSDVKHTKDIWSLLQTCSISPQEWGWMCNTTEVAAKLYFQLYVEAAR